MTRRLDPTPACTLDLACFRSDGHEGEHARPDGARVRGPRTKAGQELLHALDGVLRPALQDWSAEHIIAIEDEAGRARDGS